MSDASLWWAVAAGGSFGALVRAAVYGTLARRTRLHPERAWAGLGLARASLVVNLTGSFLLGLSATMLPTGAGDEPIRVFFVAGFCGSLTTFSSLCLDTVSLARANRRVPLVAYLLANGVLGVAAFSLGLAVVG